MMFMMPTPPTTSETLATEPRSKVITMVMMFRTLATSEVFRTVKSSSLPWRMWCRWRKRLVTSSSVCFI